VRERREPVAHRGWEKVFMEGKQSFGAKVPQLWFYGEASFVFPKFFDVINTC
jgi:hypothetical protein